MKTTTIERIIAKIDNDFNPDNSDWIPRVAAWCLDAMSQLKVLATEKKTRKVKVIDRIAILPCPISGQGFAVYDSNGCELKEYDGKQNCCSTPSTGDEFESDTNNSLYHHINGTLGHVHTKTVNKAPNVQGVYTGSKDITSRYVVKELEYGDCSPKNSYTIVDDCKLELTNDADYIIVENLEIKTDCNNSFGCELPVIPDNGILIEAITNYCMYRMLTRGYQHPIFTIATNVEAINPYLLWNKLKDKAKTSIKLDNQKEINTKAWQSMFYNFTFKPRK